MKTTIPVLLLFFLCSFSFAQNSYSIKGIVADTSSKAKLVNSTITVLQATDSILHKFTRTTTGGSFSINNMASGKFILLVTYRGYADYVARFSLDSVNRTHDFGQLNLILKAKLLEEIVINAGAITIKGDTTVFNASSYKVQANAKVEDLLKQMPGIQIDQNGKITAQGQAVNKVLVDGEEFFGSDPVLVTRNLRADMVKSVELFDKKSDAAKFTGIDDGERTRTLNVVLKDNSKNGYFGKVEGGESPDLSFYVGQGMFNSFTGRSKVSAYATAGNTNKLGLSGQDAAKYGSGAGGMLFAGEGGIIDLSGVLGGGVITGLPTSRNGGFHYDTKWNTNKETLNMNYSTGFNGNKLISNVLMQNNLPTGGFDGVSDSKRNNESGYQRFDAAYVGNFNPTTMLRINASGSLNSNDNSEVYSSTNTRTNDIILNHSNRTLTNEGNSKSFNMGGFFTKRFKKAGRSIGINLSQSLNRNDSDGYLYNLTDYYNTLGTKESTDILDQYKPVISKGQSFNSGISYSEPLSKTTNMGINYGLSLSNSSSNRESFNKSSSGKYDVRDNIYSNNFETDLLTHRIGSSINFNRRKTLLNFQVNLNAVDQKQRDLNNSKDYNRNFLTWFSYGNYTYRMSQQKSLTLTWNGQTGQPSIDQLQPIRVNTDPLFITVGNPDLKSFSAHGFSARYASTKPLTGQSLFLSATYSLRSNVIVQKTTTDPATGKTTTQWVNLTEKHPDFYNFDITTGNKLKKSDINVTLNWNTTGQHAYNYINSVLNTSHHYTFNFYTTLSKTKVKKYDFNIRFGPGYRIQGNSVSTAPNNGWVLRDDNTFNLYLPGKTQLSITANYIFRQKSDLFPDAENFSMMTWNSTISKKFFTKENLILSISGNDLLNQNVSYLQNTSTNYTSQTYNNTLARYLMFSVVWDFAKPSKASAAAPVTLPPGARPMPPGAVRPAPSGTPPAGGAPATRPATAPTQTPAQN